MDDLTIRPARPGEAAALRALVERAYGRYVERIGGRPRPMDDDYDKRTRGGHAFLAERAGVTVGLIVLVPGDDHLHVDNVAVDPRHQRAGIGRALLAFAEEQARGRGAREVNLYTNAKMTENRALYPRLGYRETEQKADGGYERVFFSKQIERG